MANGGYGFIPLAPQGGGVMARAAAESSQKQLPVMVGPIAARKAVKYLDQATGKQGIALKTLLTAQKMQFHQQLVHHPPVEGGHQEGEGAMEGALAVGNREGVAHARYTK
jgi:hypothetical protein